MGLLWFVIIGASAGWFAGQFMKGNGFGLIGLFTGHTTGRWMWSR